MGREMKAKGQFCWLRTTRRTYSLFEKFLGNATWIQKSMLLRTAKKLCAI